MSDNLTARNAQVPATPQVRQIATRHGVNLAALTGTGAGGRITTADVRATTRRPKAQPATPGVPLLAHQLGVDLDDVDVPDGRVTALDVRAARRAANERDDVLGRLYAPAPEPELTAEAQALYDSCWPAAAS